MRQKREVLTWPVTAGRYVGWSVMGDVVIDVWVSHSLVDALAGRSDAAAEALYLAFAREHASRWTATLRRVAKEEEGRNGKMGRRH